MDLAAPHRPGEPVGPRLMTRSVFHDFADLVISTDAAAAAHAYSRGVQLLITSSAEAGAVLRDAVRADPNFALARVALALAVDARGLAAEDHDWADWADTTFAAATRRERQHIEVIGWFSAASENARPCSGREHLREFPKTSLSRMS